MTDIEEKQYREQKESNLWLAVNTIFTVLSGLAMLYLAFKSR